jgi:hypothetical protein
MKAKVTKQKTSWGYYLYVSRAEAEANDLTVGEVLDISITSRKMDKKVE